MTNSIRSALKAVCLVFSCVLVVSCAGKAEKDDPDLPVAILEPSSAEVSQTPDELSSAEQKALQEAISQLDSDDLSEAIKKLSKLKKKTPHPSILSNLSLAYFRNNQFEQAANTVAEALSLQPENAHLSHLDALIKLKQNNYPAAEKGFKKAISLNKDYALAHYNLALLYDIYFQELKPAYEHYLIYLNLIDYQDADTITWVEQLKYSVGAD